MSSAIFFHSGLPPLFCGPCLQRAMFHYKPQRPRLSGDSRASRGWWWSSCLNCLSILFCAVSIAAAPRLVAVLPKWDSSQCTCIWNCQIPGQGFSSGPQQESGSNWPFVVILHQIHQLFTAGIWARLIAVHRMLLRWLWHCCHAVARSLALSTLHRTLKSVHRLLQLVHSRLSGCVVFAGMVSMSWLGLSIVTL